MRPASYCKINAASSALIVPFRFASAASPQAKCASSPAENWSTTSASSELTRPSQLPSPRSTSGVGVEAAGGVFVGVAVSTTGGVSVNAGVFVGTGGMSVGVAEPAGGTIVGDGVAVASGGGAVPQLAS